MYALITGASSGCGYEYARIMAEKGYKVARRTIAKYRDQLGIPKARLRKEL